ncbi:MAG: DUF6433 family protein [Candidatus Nanopelagicales bacterium]
MTTTTQKKTSTTKTTKPKVVKETPIVELPNNPLAFEIFDLISKQRSKEKKVELLQKYNHDSIRALLIWNFDESVITMLPSGPVPYSSYDDQTVNSGTLSTKITEEIRAMYETGSFSLGVSDTQGRTTIRKEYKNFYHFIKGGNDSMSTIRRETMFINLLQGLHPLEAEIICLVKDKKLEEKYKLTKEIVSEAFPQIKWGGRS